MLFLEITGLPSGRAGDIFFPLMETDIAGQSISMVLDSFLLCTDNLLPLNEIDKYLFLVSTWLFLMRYF